MTLIDKLNKIEKFIGNTKVYELEFDTVKLFAKLEYGAFMGSIKDRLAFYMMKQAIIDGHIDENTVIVESSSGNFAIGLAGICKCLNLKFIAVIDPNITREKEGHLSYLAYKTIKVNEIDRHGSYLLTRIATIEKLLKENNNYFNIDQYRNNNNFLCYLNTLAYEIINDFEKLDYIFVAVSTGGTVTGLSLKLKEHYPNIKVIAVDIEGSIVFSDKKKERNISGLGASRKSSFIKNEFLDDAVILSQDEIIQGCAELFSEQMIFAGGSSGAVYTAVKKVLGDCNDPDTNVLLILPDRGHAYIDSVYKQANPLQQNKFQLF